MHMNMEWSTKLSKFDVLRWLCSIHEEWEPLINGKNTDPFFRVNEVIRHHARREKDRNLSSMMWYHQECMSLRRHLL